MIPTYQQIEDPLLRILEQASPMTLRDAVEAMAAHFELTSEERAATLKNGKRNFNADRTAWAATYLAMAGLVSRPSRGVLSITDRGREVLGGLGAGEQVDNDVLNCFDEFREFRSRSSKESQASGTAESDEDSETPDARIASAVNELNDALSSQLLERVQSMDPAAFEHLVVDLLVKMGYGGSQAEAAGSVVGASGDGGIDGLIKEDRLGLDSICVQAKRWKDGNTVGRPDVQQFMGALVGRGARKGIFITASSFSSGAREFVQDKDISIVLLDGKQLVALMIEHGVGVADRDTVVIKDLDEDYFDGA